MQLKALEANAISTRTMYEAFVTRLRETQGAVGLPDARVISSAAVPTAPSSPKRTLIAAASIPAGLLIGLLFALIAERTDPAGEYRSRPAQTWQPAAAQVVADPLRGATVLGEIPDYAALRAADIVVDHPHDFYANAVDALLTRIAPGKSGAGGKVIALTAADQSEGRTALATALARTAAKRGLRVIVVDGDFQWPKAALAMGLPPHPQGLQDVLSGATPLSQSLARDTRSTALLLSPVGTQAPNAISCRRCRSSSLICAALSILSSSIAPHRCSLMRRGDFFRLPTLPWFWCAGTLRPARMATQTIDRLHALHVPAAGVVFAR